MRTFNDAKWPSKMIPVLVNLEHLESTEYHGRIRHYKVSKAEWQDSFRAAMATWNNAGANFQFAESSSNYQVDVIMVESADLTNASSGTDLYDQNGNGNQAPGGQIHRVVIKINRQRPFKIQEGHMLFHDDPETIALHELGHALGLDDSTDRFSIMFVGDIGKSEAQRWLSDDDVSGICHLYGVATRYDDGLRVKTAKIIKAASPWRKGYAFAV